jgi:hypothetical protein
MLGCVSLSSLNIYSGTQKKNPKVRNRFPILDIYKCPFSESGRGLLKTAESETIKKSYGLKPKKN